MHKVTRPTFEQHKSYHLCSLPNLHPTPPLSTSKILASECKSPMSSKFKRSNLNLFSVFGVMFLLYLQEFNKKSNSLYTILRSSRLAGSQRAPFLRRFLLRLNFNSYFEVRTIGGIHNYIFE